MKKVFILILSIACINIVTAQDAPKPDSKAAKPTKEKSKITVAPKRLTVAHPSDHILIQFGSDSWLNKPDEAKTNGGRHFNFYIMTDKPFKTNPKFSVAYGLGIGSSNIYFDKVYADIKGNAVGGTNEDKLTFGDAPGGNHFNKFKMTQIFLELPVELRFTANPENADKSWKFAVGAKVGTLLKAYTKGKDLQSSTNVSLYGPTFIEKEYSKKLFNTTRLSLTGRVGYGNFSLSAAYAVTPVIKSGFVSKDFNTLSIGITISGL